MRKRNTDTCNGGQRSRLGAKVATAVATLSLVASMCPGVAALAFANGQLAAGSASLEAQDGEIPVTPDTHEMTTGTYRVTGEVTINPPEIGGNGIKIKEGANVTLILDSGAKLSVTGSDADSFKPGSAAILLPEDATLTVQGEGMLVAHGGNARPGSDGEFTVQSFISALDREVMVAADGGKGGRGGAGAGAGIGTDGGEGGEGGSGGALVTQKRSTVENVYGKDGGRGADGNSAALAGRLIVSEKVQVFAYGGAGSLGGKGGHRGGYCENLDFFSGHAGGTSAGGGGGGGGAAGDGIGSGGSGGGGGGGGASANIDGEFAFYGACDLDDLWGHGGLGGAGARDGADGANGDEGANGGDDTDASKKYAKAGGAGGSCPARATAAFYTIKNSDGSYPAVTCKSGDDVERAAKQVNSLGDIKEADAKTQVEKPEAAALTFKCADWETGEGAEQSPFAALEADGYAFDPDAVASDGTASTSSAKNVGSYKACFKLKDPATCQWKGESEDTAEVWVPWSISLQQIDPNDVTYWGPSYDNATTTVAYTGEPVWVRPWFAPAADAGGKLPERLTHWGDAGRPTAGRDSALVVYRQGEDDHAGLVGYHQNADGSLEPVTAAQVLAWRNGVDVNGQHVDVQSGDTVWYKTDSDGKATALAVQSAAPASADGQASAIAAQSEEAAGADGNVAAQSDAPEGADGSYVARDLSYVTHLGVKDPGTYTATALIGEGEGFAHTARPTATVEVTAPAKEAPTKAAPAKAASSSPKTGDFDPRIASGIAIVALIAAGALALSRRRA